MLEITKIVRQMTSATHIKPTRLRRAVGRPFWWGLPIGAALVALLLVPLWSTMAWLALAAMAVGAFVAGLGCQIGVDLYRGARAGEVRKVYFYGLLGMIFLAAAYGILYYQTPEEGLEKVLLRSCLVLISVLFGYVLGRADRPAP